MWSITANPYRKLHVWWGCAFTFMMMLNLDQFGYTAGFGPAPKYWAIGIFIASVLTFLSGGRVKEVLRAPLTWWAVTYVLVSFLGALGAQNQEGAVDGMFRVTTTFLYAISALLIYSSIPSNEPLWGITLWSALLIAVSSVLIEYFLPSFQSFSEIGQGIEGRAAGLYLNPNIAGLAILMILSCILLRSSLFSSALASIVALAGLVATFSRSSMICWLILVILAGFGKAKPIATLMVIATVALTAIVAGPTVFDFLSSFIPEGNQNTLDRLAWALGQGNLNDDATSQRGDVARFAWDEYFAAPIFGHGLGYTWVWDIGPGTHNMVLQHLVEYGVIGLFIFPMFIYLSILSAKSAKPGYRLWLTAAMVLFMSVFNHNMFEQGVFMFPWLAACLIRPSKKRPQKRLVERPVNRFLASHKMPA
jgi:O-antigen ligase